jgi:hypothetical protein
MQRFHKTISLPYHKLYYYYYFDKYYSEKLLINFSIIYWEIAWQSDRRLSATFNGRLFDRCFPVNLELLLPGVCK